MQRNLLPPELQELEDRLLGRPGVAPAESMRTRILHEVDAELSLAKETSCVRTRPGWYWLAAAASIVIVLNISAISASRDEFSPGPAVNANQIATELQMLRGFEARQEGVFK